MEASVHVGNSEPPDNPEYVPSLSRGLALVGSTILASRLQINSKRPGVGRAEDHLHIAVQNTDVANQWMVPIRSARMRTTGL
eukprot:5604893-Karenia_brevis.AAC.1